MVGTYPPVTLNQRVPGSSPGAPTNLPKTLYEGWWLAAVSAAGDILS